METAFARTNMSVYNFALLLILQDLHQNFTNDEQK